LSSLKNKNKSRKLSQVHLISLVGGVGYVNQKRIY
jgi:hypothetical protein